MKHPLKKLIGKTITKLSVSEYDQCGDGESVGEKISITCSDGEKFTFYADGGDGPFYAVVSDIDPMDIADYDDGE